MTPNMLWVLIEGNYDADFENPDSLAGWAYLFTTREKALAAIYGPLMGSHAPRLRWRKQHATFYEAISPGHDRILYTLIRMAIDDDYGGPSPDDPPIPDLDAAPADWPD